MTLKDRLNEAMAATPPENTYRLDALRAALNAGDDDAEIAEALTRLIEARETKAAAFDRAGQSEQAKAERDEASKLREILQIPESAAAAKASAVTARKKSGGIFSRKQIIIGGVALAVVAVALAVTLRPWSQDDAASTTSGKVAIFKDDHTMGNPNAPIVLVEYAAPMCPICARFMREDFPTLKREFIDTGKIFYVFRVFPLGAPDGAVEGIARCLPPNRYFPYIEMMYREQSQWDPDGYQIPDVEGAIVRLASAEGVSPDRAKQCMVDPAQQQSINQIAQDAQLKYQIDSVPTFVMNGQVVNIPPGTTRLEVLRLRINSLSNPQQQ